MGQDNRNDSAMLEERIAGRSVIAIAEQYECTTSDVEGAIDRRLNFALDNDQRLKAVKLDCARIEALMMPFFERATSGAHGAHHRCRLHLKSPVPTSLVGKCCVLLSR